MVHVPLSVARRDRERNTQNGRSGLNFDAGSSWPGREALRTVWLGDVLRPEAGRSKPHRHSGPSAKCGIVSKSRHMAITFAWSALTLPPLGPILNPAVLRALLLPRSGAAKAGGLLHGRVAWRGGLTRRGGSRRNRGSSYVSVLRSSRVLHVGIILQNHRIAMFHGF